MVNPKIEFRIWNDSVLIGKSIKQITDMGVRVYKVTRGNLAKNPPEDLKLEEADYVGIVGSKAACINVVKKSKPI